MARKSKGFGELLRQKQGSVERLAERVKQDLNGKVANVVINPKGEAKMSEVMKAFVKPYLDVATSRDRRLKLLTIAAFAWNLTLLPDEQQQQSELDKIVDELAGQNRQFQHETRELIEELMERKRTLFAENKRYIFDFELKESRNDFQLAVVSSLVPEQQEQSKSQT